MLSSMVYFRMKWQAVVVVVSASNDEFKGLYFRVCLA